MRRKKKEKKNIHAIEGMRNEIVTRAVYRSDILMGAEKRRRKKSFARVAKLRNHFPGRDFCGEIIFGVLTLFYALIDMTPAFSFFFSIFRHRRKKLEKYCKLTKEIKG